MTNQGLNALIAEAGYRSAKESVLKDENGEYEWIERENYDGKIERMKKYKDPKVV